MMCSISKWIKQKFTNKQYRYSRLYKKKNRSKGKKVLNIAFRQGKLFKRFKNSERFRKILNELNASPSTVYYELNLLKVLEKHSKQEKSSLALNISKNYFKTKKETCKESGTELKKTELCNFLV